jgi:hypothetical protein
MLTEGEVELELAFRECFRAYLGIIRAWLSFSESELRACAGCGFFIDLERALSMEGDRFFEVSKVVHRELVPSFFANHYQRIVELGKTVQFIKLYFNEQDLLLFHTYLDIDQEFQALNCYFGSMPRALPPTLKGTTRKPTISSRCTAGRSPRVPKASLALS